MVLSSSGLEKWPAQRTWKYLFTTMDQHELCLGLAGVLESSDGRAGDSLREDDESAQKGPLRSCKSLSPDGLTLRRPDPDWLKFLT